MGFDRVHVSLLGRNGAEETASSKQTRARAKKFGSFSSPMIQYRHKSEGIVKKLRIWATVALTLAVLALVLLAMMILALTDISHGEQNDLTEWGIVRLGLAVIFFLIVATFICTGLVLKYFRDRSAPEGPKPRP